MNPICKRAGSSRSNNLSTSITKQQLKDKRITMKTNILTLQQEMVTTQPKFNLGSSKVFGTLTEMSNIQYRWKDGGWKSLGEYPTLYAEYELSKLKRLYSYEYDFRLAPSKLGL